jgi:hypothetical protein
MSATIPYRIGKSSGGLEKTFAGEICAGLEKYQSGYCKKWSVKTSATAVLIF